MKRGQGTRIARLTGQPQRIRNAERAAFTPSTWNTEDRTVEMTLSTGARGMRYDWWTEQSWEEELDLDGARIDRLNNGAPFLRVHEQLSADAVLGVFVEGSVRKQDGAITGVVRFAADDSLDDEGRRIVAKLRDGIMRNISIGYSVREWERIKAKDREDGGTVDLYIARDWEVMEASIVPIGFDDTAKTRAADNRGASHVEEGDHDMKKFRTYLSPDGEGGGGNGGDPATGARAQEPATAQAAPAPTPAPDPAALERARKDEQARILAIQTRAAAAARLAPDLKKEIEAEQARCIEGGATADAAAVRMMDIAAQAGEQTRTSGAQVQPGADLAHSRALQMADAIMLRMNPKHQPEVKGSNPYAFRSLLDLARCYVEEQGRSCAGLSPAQIAQTAFRLRHERALSTSDFPYVLEAVMGKSLRAAYEMNERTFTPFCRQRNLPDFKDAKEIMFGEAPALLEVKEGAPYKEGSITEARETWHLSKFGRIVSVTWEMIVNDDLGAMNRIPQLMGAQAAIKQNEIVWAIITGNEVMGDTKTLFHDDHRNQITSGTTCAAPSVATMDAMRRLMRVQKGVDGVTTIRVTPAFILCPEALRTTVDQLLSLTYVPTQASNVMTTTLRSMTPVSDPLLDASSTVKWYTSANPAQFDTINYGFLDGENGPVMEEEMGFDSDGARWKIRQVFGAKAVDFRGLAYNAGVVEEG